MSRPTGRDGIVDELERIVRRADEALEVLTAMYSASESALGRLHQDHEGLSTETLARSAAYSLGRHSDVVQRAASELRRDRDRLLGHLHDLQRDAS